MRFYLYQSGARATAGVVVGMLRRPTVRGDDSCMLKWSLNWLNNLKKMWSVASVWRDVFIFFAFFRFFLVEGGKRSFIKRMKKRIKKSHHQRECFEKRIIKNRFLNWNLEFKKHLENESMSKSILYKQSYELPPHRRTHFLSITFLWPSLPNHQTPHAYN